MIAVTSCQLNPEPPWHVERKHLRQPHSQWLVGSDETLTFPPEIWSIDSGNFLRLGLLLGLDAAANVEWGEVHLPDHLLDISNGLRITLDV